MASFGIHLAIANKYLKNHPEENEKEFILGTLDVDLAQDKIASHYTISADHSNFIRFLDGKVDLSSYVKANSIKSSYARGYFLHLITDYYFYTSFFDKKWLSSISYDEFKKILYHDYESTNEHILQKYNIEYPEVIKKYNISSKEDSIIITEDSIDEFIDRLSSIDLDNLYSSLNISPKMK